MSEAYIVDIIRTPIVRVRRDGSSYTTVHPADLLAVPLRALVERNGFDPVLVDDVIGGCVTQIGRQSNNITRSAVLAAGYPQSVPATTVDRQCGSSMQSVVFGAQGVQAGAYDLVIGAGVESMSTTAMFSNKNGEDPFGPAVMDRYQGGGLVEQGISAELVAARWGLSREAMDAYSVQSHQRAAAAQAAGRAVAASSTQGVVVVVVAGGGGVGVMVEVLSGCSQPREGEGGGAVELVGGYVDQPRRLRKGVVLRRAGNKRSIY